MKCAINDQNSNVRMTAVKVIASRLEEPHMKNILMKTFVEQDDPLIQDELIDLISNLDHGRLSEGVKNKLFVLTNDPTTMDFVKDKAYAALLTH